MFYNGNAKQNGYSAERWTGIFGGNQLIMEQTKAKEYILYNEVTNEYLTRVTFMGSTVYKTTTLDLAMRFSEQDKENLEAMGAGNPEKVLNNIEATAFGNDSDVKETYRLSNLSFLSINDLTLEERGSLRSGNRRRQKESREDSLLPDRQQIIRQDAASSNQSNQSLFRTEQ